jgi:hypothetical protein
VQPSGVDDRTDDCACGAMMSMAVRPKFRKLRFQMIADIVWSVDGNSPPGCSDIGFADERHLATQFVSQRHSSGAYR